ncbi:uncharacterized protein P174DRAFT_379584 [Aspergillus novofumigatus IBT 16806]|uniref:Uncharacterized protein n=1 Tax=Aspergillus novofumigatus (strain IBT 16806) TaxID=1392255 RepID=A0A2I1BUE0_ASPN1|nr:uncharacterized protein P174DRAFT_379584 [Aspergillus novofumigatus IBT 16806]PKX88964.1 hypothetical protein P174DRAFT_379584 [Aspergillus novofumigatus IBT 16806]
MSRPIDAFPEEILIQILTSLKLTSNLQFPRRILTCMLLHLPQTCINLEITICGPEEQTNCSSDDFCKTLSILPRLRHLRLQVARVCPEFLGEAALGKYGTGDSVCIQVFKPCYAPNLN